ncbi:hypothetical protein PRZ48_012939 [Zasmidium cellare]|uniref:RNA polymerase II degradation factor 1 n=1 Tax=Zasmidium cellare TaxID=395010 RepID=A0ABR0E388_ZASCE|nr:hypothetical protein PRZ48_012939 [Zasmidium cellare]
MSESDARTAPARGRSSTRGGRGGIGRGGPRGGRKPNGTSNDATVVAESLDEQGEIGEMKKKYLSELGMLKDMFPDWTDTDLVFALEEADGDLPSTVDKITQGAVSQFAEVKKPKDRARSKVKDEPAAAGAADKPAFSARGRGRGGFESTRGGRGRGSERGRGGHRGGRGGHATTNGTAKEGWGDSVPTGDSTAWDTPATTSAADGGWDTAAPEATKDTAEASQSAWGTAATVDSTPAAAAAPEAAKSSLIPETGPKKSWASMFAKPKPAPAPVPTKQILTKQQPPVETTVSEEAVPIPAPAEVPAELPVPSEPEPVPTPAIQEPETPAAPQPDTAPVERPLTSEGADLTLTPSKDPLTEENVEHLPDESHPPATQTVASTTGSIDPRNLTPLPSHQAPIGRPPMGGFATSASRLAGTGGRTASFQRRVQEQQEAVVMPGHNAVDRAAVQFGSMGLNGEPGLDVDDDREEPETRLPPQHSPPSQPRTSLPPAPREAGAAQAPGIQSLQAAHENLPTPKQAPGLPPASVQNQQQMQDPSLTQGLPQEHQMNQAYNQYGRYGQPGMHQQQDSGAQQKPYDPFGSQGQQSHFDQYGAHHQQAPQQQTQSGFGGLSSAPSDYSSYYTSDQPRNAYNQYYGSSYAPQDNRNTVGQAQAQHDANVAPQRSTSGFGATAAPAESAFASQSAQQVSTDIQKLQSLLHTRAETSQKEAMARLDYQIQQLSEKIQVEHMARQTGSKAMGLRQSFATPLKPTDPDDELARRERDAAIGRNTTILAGSATSPQEPRIPEMPVTLLPPSQRHLPPSPKLRTRKQTFSNQHYLQAQQAPSRFAEAAGSGHNTPNPLMGGQQPSAPNAAQQQSQHSMHQAQGHQQGSYGGAGYPYGHPFYSSPYQQAYQNQFGYSHQPVGYGGGFPGNKGSMYGAPHGYGMGSQSSYEQHSSSPANANAFSQNQQASMRSASGMGSGLGGLDEYGRGAAQSGSHQQSSGFGNVNDPFARSASGFGQGGYGQHAQHAQQNMTAGPEDALKPFNDSKSGPSPALGQPGRPGSAANSAAGTSQSGLPPPQGQHSAFGGYPGFQGQNSQYGGLGGLGNHGQGQQSSMGGQQSAYGGYGGGFNQTYGGYGASRGGGGWGASYGH